MKALEALMLSRRQILAGASVLTVFGPVRAFADKTCSVDAGDQAVKNCTVGLQIGEVETIRQRCEQWCWAACVQTIFSLHNRDVAQETVVEKLFGSEVCEPATAIEIIEAINGRWIDALGFEFDARAEELPLAAMGIAVTASDTTLTDSAGLALDFTTDLFAADAIRRLVLELESGNPLIIGALSHATVLTAASYRESDNTIELTELVVRDPWPDSENRRTLSKDEVRDAFFVVKVMVG